jgi:hypothetical protein
MAYEIDVLDVTLLAAGDLSTYQYRFVKLSADNTVTVCGNGEQAIGILQNKPSAAGQAARVRVFGVSRFSNSTAGAIAFGVLLGSAANGQGVAVTADKAYYNGVVIDGVPAQNDIGTVMITGVHTLSA